MSLLINTRQQAKIPAGGNSRQARDCFFSFFFFFSPHPREQRVPAWHDSSHTYHKCRYRKIARAIYKREISRARGITTIRRFVGNSPPCPPGDSFSSRLIFMPAIIKFPSPEGFGKFVIRSVSGVPFSRACPQDLIYRRSFNLKSDCLNLRSAS